MCVSLPMPRLKAEPPPDWAGVFLPSSPPPSLPSVPPHLSHAARVHSSPVPTLIHRPSTRRYLGGSSKLGTRCHRFLSAVTSRTDNAEAAAMSLQPRHSPSLRHSSCVPLTAKPCLRSASLLSSAGHRPGQSQAIGEPKGGGGVSTKTNQRTEQGLGCGDWPVCPRAAAVRSPLPPPLAPTGGGVGYVLSLPWTRNAVSSLGPRRSFVLEHCS